jgi:hypothetical protein
MVLGWLLNCCWSSTAHWYFVSSSTRLVTIFYCLTALGACRSSRLHSFNVPLLCAYLLPRKPTVTCCLPAVESQRMAFLVKLYRLYVTILSSHIARLQYYLSRKSSTRCFQNMRYLCCYPRNPFRCRARETKKPALGFQRCLRQANMKYVQMSV